MRKAESESSFSDGIDLVSLIDHDLGIGPSQTQDEQGSKPSTDSSSVSKFCVECGMQLPKTAKFCASCGERQP